MDALPAEDEYQCGGADVEEEAEKEWSGCERKQTRGGHYKLMLMADGAKLYNGRFVIRKGKRRT